MKLKDLMIAMQFLSKAREVTPNNNVSQFIHDAFADIFSGDEELKPVSGILVSQANDKPDIALEKMARFHYLFWVWYKSTYKEEKTEIDESSTNLRYY